VLLSSNFQFSQSSLQDLSDCPRRFQLKYINNLLWPAVEAEPALDNEKFLLLGNNFHKLAQQHFLGVPSEELTSLAETNEHLSKWWENFIIFQSEIANQSKYLYPEVSLSAPFADYRLYAKFDLLSIGQDNHLIIYDWKTSRNLPKRSWLKKRLQTRAYPYILVRSANSFSKFSKVSPDNIEMVYWFSNHPTESVRFRYTVEQFKRDETYLTELIRQAETLPAEGPAPLTINKKFCKYCIYRSLCNRGTKAGLMAEIAMLEIDETDVDSNLEQIGEFEY
jgi:hypothetical protein